MREFLQEKALTNNVIVCDSQKKQQQPEKKQLILYAVKDVVDHSIHSWGRYKDCMRTHNYKTDVHRWDSRFIPSFYCIIVLSLKNIFYDMNNFKLG